MTRCFFQYWQIYFRGTKGLIILKSYYGDCWAMIQWLQKGNHNQVFMKVVGSISTFVPSYEFGSLVLQRKYLTKVFCDHDFDMYS